MLRLFTKVQKSFYATYATKNLAIDQSSRSICRQFMKTSINFLVTFVAKHLDLPVISGAM
jgi:hypothetical protein